MNGGFVKLHRKCMESRYFSMGLRHIGMFKVLLLRANWKTGYFLGVQINPGEMGISISGLAADLNEDRRVVRKILDDLQTYGMITRKNVANRWTHITICNWATYQLCGDNGLPTDAQQSDQPLPSKVTTIEEGKNDKKEKKTTTKGKFKTPTLAEVEEYFKEKGLRVSPKKFFDYFEAGDWFDSNGKKVARWKQKALTWEGHYDEKRTGKPGAVGSSNRGGTNTPEDYEGTF